MWVERWPMDGSSGQCRRGGWAGGEADPGGGEEEGAANRGEAGSWEKEAMECLGLATTPAGEGGVGQVGSGERRCGVF